MSATDEDARDVCVAASRVFSFFRELDLYKTSSLILSTVAGMPDEMGPAALGCFEPERGVIRVLTFEAASSRGTWFGRSIDRALYRSLVAHEIAHALAWCNRSGGPLSVRGGEYIAYAVMFETMDPAVRAAILADAPGSGFESDRQISDTYFHLSPSRFGVEAYRHYLRPGNGPRFLREILRGSALPARED